MRGHPERGHPGEGGRPPVPRQDHVPLLPGHGGLHGPSFQHPRVLADPRHVLHHPLLHHHEEADQGIDSL